MGGLWYFDLRQFACKQLVETGLGHGESLRHAAQFPFERLFSTEIDQQVAAKYGNFTDSRIQVVPLETKAALRQILPQLSPEPTLFWLDAHLPGHWEDRGYDEVDFQIRCPLEGELEVIVAERDISQDVFLMDDLRIYIDGPFQCGNWSERKRLGGDGIEFVYRLLGPTHDIALDYRHQGYIIARPRA